jgi:hypothetical protein
MKALSFLYINYGKFYNYLFTGRIRARLSVAPGCLAENVFVR